MSSTECLRDLINERLTAAAEEIFRAFQATIIRYEEEIDRQSRLLELVLNPELKLHRTELPQQHVCKEKEVLAKQQLRDQERNSNLDQDNPETPQIKEEDEELCISLDRDDPEPPQVKEEQDELCSRLHGEQRALKQEAETFMLTLYCEENDASIDQMVPVETQRAAEKERIVIMSVEDSVGPKPISDDQLFSHSSNAAESPDRKGGSRTTGNAEPRPKKICQTSKTRPNSEVKSTAIKAPGDTDAGKRRFKCDICAKSLMNKSKLQLHMKIHTGEKPYPCGTCEKRFYMPSDLNKHMRVHTGEKPYPCNACEKRFSQVNTLQRHMRTHTGERPYPCNTCGKRFSERAKLKRHMKIHMEKPRLHRENVPVQPAKSALQSLLALSPFTST